MNLKPLHNHVLLKLEDAAPKTKGGLFIPDNAKEKPQQAFVVAVGPAVTDVKQHDTIIFTKYAGTEVDIDGVAHLLLAEDHILGVVES